MSSLRAGALKPYSFLVGALDSEAFAQSLNPKTLSPKFPADPKHRKP